jgi:Ca2+-transporting ATPase
VTELIPHSSSAQDVVKAFSSDAESGLDSKDIARLQSEYGPNVLAEKKKRTLIGRFFDQFKDVMIIILLIAAAVSFGVICVEKTWNELFEPALILIIVILNALMGVFQESKAEKALEALKNMSAPHARVIRDGEEHIIDAKQIVPGDIIKVEAGDFVPADARLIHSVSLKSEESALTGESVPAEKNADDIIDGKSALGDRSNMIFSGCSITYGTGLAVVTATGMNTEMGKIANLLAGEKESQTPLQQKLAQLGKYLGIIALAACAIVFVIGLISGIPILEIFMTSVSLAVSAIPEGLPAIVTIILSIGVQRMAKRNALIRRLPAVETLGSASVICSDKTGTLTQNRMTVVKAFTDGESDAETVGDSCSEKIKQLLIYGTLCSDGTVVFENGVAKHIGDPTETAIVLAAHKNGIKKEEIIKKYERLAEIPFDSDRKLMTSVNRIDGKNIVIVKGAFDNLSLRCTAGNVEKAREVTEEMSREALRVLAIAIKEMETVPQNPTSEELENGLTLIGLIGMIDPPRAEAKDAVATSKKAGIKTVMITGDHVITAAAIAKQLGIYSDGDRAITGKELDAMSDEELEEHIEKISVYARVSPENKIRIVKAWQKKGHVVSMTGDGVNDAPALKAADIGCAMEITGTDVAKGAADMTLTDDNFATIVDAVKEGRGIYANIRKVVGFLLGSNTGEILTVFTSMLLFRETPLLSMQLLWVNLVTDSLPAIAVGMESVEPDVMEKKPRPKDEGIFANGLGFSVIIQGILFAAITLLGFYIGKTVMRTLEAGQTMAFMILSLSQVVHAFNMRSEHSLFRIGFFSNKTLNIAAVISTLLMAVVLFTPVRYAFKLVLLTPQLYLTALGLIFVPLVALEIKKAVKSLIKKNKNK